MKPVDMSPAAVEARLAEVARASRLDFAPLARVDMSPGAVEARMAECAELSAFCLDLARTARGR